MSLGLRVVAVAEALTGTGLLVLPGMIGALLFGVPLTDPLAVVAARIAGLALIALAVACLGYRLALAMLIYSAGATVVLALVGVAGGMTGVLLWPAVVAHVLATAVLAREVMSQR